MCPSAVKQNNIDACEIAPMTQLPDSIAHCAGKCRSNVLQPVSRIKNEVTTAPAIIDPPPGLEKIFVLVRPINFEGGVVCKSIEVPAEGTSEFFDELVNLVSVGTLDGSHFFKAVQILIRL